MTGSRAEPRPRAARPLIEKSALQMGAVLWAMVGFAVAATSVVAVESGPAPLVVVATIVFPLCALVAGLAVQRDRMRTAGAFFVLSAATPTYFAWVLNVPALLVGAVLLVAPWLTVKGGAARRSRA